MPPLEPPLAHLRLKPPRALVDPSNQEGRCTPTGRRFLCHQRFDSHERNRSRHLLLVSRLVFVVSEYCYLQRQRFQQVERFYRRNIYLLSRGDRIETLWSLQPTLCNSDTSSPLHGFLPCTLDTSHHGQVSRIQWLRGNACISLRQQLYFVGRMGIL